MVRRVIREIVIRETVEEDDKGDRPNVVDQSSRPRADAPTTDIVAVQPTEIETARLRFGALSSYFRQ